MFCKRCSLTDGIIARSVPTCPRSFSGSPAHVLKLRTLRLRGGAGIFGPILLCFGTPSQDCPLLSKQGDTCSKMHSRCIDLLQFSMHWFAPIRTPKFCAHFPAHPA